MTKGFWYLTKKWLKNWLLASKFVRSFVYLKYEIIQKTGAWFAYNGEKIAQGREKAIDYIENNPEIANEIKDKILEIFKNGKN